MKMRFIKIAFAGAFLLTSKCIAGNVIQAPIVLDIKLSEQRYIVAKQKLIENNLIGQFASCSMRLNAAAVTHKGGYQDLNNNIAKISRYCANELSHRVDIHPKEFSDFLKRLDDENLSRTLWFNSDSYIQHQNKLLENRHKLSEELLYALNSEVQEHITVTCDAACIEEADRLAHDGGMSLVVFSLALAGGMNTTWGGPVKVNFQDKFEYWYIPMFGNKAYFVSETPPDEAPILKPN